MSDRKINLNTWLEALGYDSSSISRASEDASFRQYFRVIKEGQSYIVMDAPPENEPCDEFIRLATALRAHGLNVPEVIEQNLAEGFLVLTDFGDEQVLGLLDFETVDAIYHDAMTMILQMQTEVPVENEKSYSAKMLDIEMELFREWFLDKLLGIELTESQMNAWQQAKNALIQSATEQPQVFVHRDFHSRNLMSSSDGSLALLDFQDAVKGPVTYDLVSLLRDCYIDWPESKLQQWVQYYYDATQSRGLINVSPLQFRDWFNLMGAQRHLKAIGIFSRLKIRDGKDGFIKDIPRTLSYVIQVCEDEKQLNGFGELINELGLNDLIQAV